MNVGRRALGTVDQAALGVRPKVQLHAVMPLIALPGLVHLGVARTLGVLGRTGGVNDRGVHHRATRDFQSPLGEQAVDAFK